MIEFYSSGLYRSSLGVPQENIDAQELERGKRIAQYINGGSHLDIGCSRGYLLAETQAKGCAVYGVEPFDGYVTQDVSHTQDLFSVTGQFDTVTCIHVFEHVYDPLKYAAKMVSLIAPGGRLIIEVPSDRSPGGPLRLAHIYHYQPPVMRAIFSELNVEYFEQNPHSLFIMRKP